MKDNLGRHQSMIAKSIESSLIMSGLFIRVGITERDSKLFIVAIPRLIFKDMTINADDDYEDFAYAVEMPEENSILNIQELKDHIVTIGQAIMIKHVSGNREVVFENKESEEPDE